MREEEVIILILVIVGIGSLLIGIFFNLTLQHSMSAVRKENRGIDPPGLIWLNFIPIPFLNSIWTMVFGIVACNSINKDAGKKIAPIALSIVYPIVGIIGSVIFYSFYTKSMYSYYYYDEMIVHAILAGVFSLANLILFIIFWSMMGSSKNKLIAMGLKSGVNVNAQVRQVVNRPEYNQEKLPENPGASKEAEEEKIKLIKGYKDLLTEGVITQEEFEQKKRDLLS